MLCGGVAVRRFSCGRRLRAAKTSDMVVAGAAAASDVARIACGEGRVTWRRRRGGWRDGAAASGATAPARAHVRDACPTAARHDSRSGVAHRAAR